MNRESISSAVVPKMAYSWGMTPEQDMHFLRFCLDDEACQYLARKVREVRRASKMSQQEFAAFAKVSLRTYKRFETHGKANLETFVQVLRGIGRTQYLLLLFPTVAPNSRGTPEERPKRIAPTESK
jgi:DNA-binding transcriptional regulator YiaG